MTTALPDIRVLDADTYTSGDPTTFGLPLAEHAYLRDEAPCYLYESNDPMLIDRAWVDPSVGGKPAMLMMDGAKHHQQRAVMSKAFAPGMVNKLEEKFRGYAVNIVCICMRTR